jgi:hypothetical protein
MIYLKTIEEVALFTAAFLKTGSTHEFEVKWVNNADGYCVRFTGAH